MNIPSVLKSESDGIKYDYHDEEVQDSLCEALLRKAYSMFRVGKILSVLWTTAV